MGGVYRLSSGLRTGSVSVSIAKVGLVLVGLMIGMSGGLYIACKTMPLPTITTQYIVR